MTCESYDVLRRSAGLLEAGDARSALAALERYPDADRWTDRRYWLLVGLVRHALGEYHEAIAAANWALSVEPHDAQLYMIRFDAEREAGLLANAELSVLTAIRLQPAEVTHHVAYAWLLASAGQLEKAERVNAAARRMAAQHVEVVWQSAELARLQGRDAEAVALGYQLLETSAPEPLRRGLLGRLLVDLEREFEGSDHLKESRDLVAGVGLDPDSVALSHHWLLQPLRFVEWLGPVATPALLIAIAIVLLALNFVTAALTVAVVIWIVILYSFFAAPLARLLRRFAPGGQPASAGRPSDDELPAGRTKTTPNGSG
jgi:tetratricopeptide (TPR) repeat protein